MIGALARVETVRLLRHPVTVVATVLCLLPWTYGQIAGAPSDRFPVLQNADRATQALVMFCFGSAALIGANLATLRAHRFRTTEPHRVLLLAPWRRAAAVLFAVAVLAGCAAVLVGVRIVVLAGQPGAVGRPSASELLTGPAIVLVMGASGVLAGHWVKVVAVAPLLVVALAAATFIAIGPAVLTAGRVRWLLPMAVDDPLAPSMPTGLIGRPAAAHLAYLVGAAALIVVATLASAGARGRRLVGTGALAVALLSAGGIGQMVPPRPALTARQVAATISPAGQQVCRTRGSVTYCAFPDFVRWIDDWDTTVRAITRRLPASVRPPWLYVRQRVFIAGRLIGNGSVPPAPVAAWAADDARAGTPDPIPVGTEWGTDEADMEFAVTVATTLVTGPHAKPFHTCGGRAVLILWLAGQSSRTVLAGLSAADANGSGGLEVAPAGFGTGFGYTHQDLHLALRLLDRPTNRVAATVSRSWPALAGGRMTADQAAAAFGVGGTVGPEDFC